MPDNRKPLLYEAFPVCRNYTVRAHLRDHGHLQRRGCENPVQYAGPLQRRVYAGHLYAHHQRYAARCGGENRRLHGIGNGDCHPGASRPAGAGSVQGDSVRESGVSTKQQGRRKYVLPCCFDIKMRIFILIPFLVAGNSCLP